VRSTAVNDPVTQDYGPIKEKALDLVRAMAEDVRDAALVQHTLEHSYKTARNRTKGIGKRILERLYRGEWPLGVDLGDATYTGGNDHYPLRYLTFEKYSDLVDERWRKAKHEVDIATAAHHNRTYLADEWGNLMLSEVVEKLKPAERK
jgi:hypothetical protein